MATDLHTRPRAIVFGCAGTALAAAEKALFRRCDPLGLILFQRNCADPEQVRALVDDFRATVGRADAPVLIDQEGGRVARLKPPHWRAAPPAARFGELALRDPARAREAVRLNARLIAAELRGLGITVDCAPVLDVPAPDAHGVIGDRAFAADPALVADLGRAACEGFLDGGVAPVIKHLPGHGRARVDSHLACPVVETDAETLDRVDFAPFRALRDAPWAMTAHVVYTAFDPLRPATISPAVVGGVMRGRIGFEGVLVSDDLSMKALGGALADRAGAALAAGCDVALHCSGALAEMEEMAATCPRLDEAAWARVVRAGAMRRRPDPFDATAGGARLDALLAGREA